MNNNKLVACAVALLLNAASTVSAGEFSYSYIDLIHEEADIELSSGRTIDAEATGIYVLFDFDERIYIGGTIFDGESAGNIDLEGWGFLMGMHHPLSDTVDLVVELSHTEVEASRGTAKNTENSEDIEIGIRAMIAPKIEVNAYFLHELDDDNDNSYSIAGLFNVTPKVAIGAGINKGDDWDSVVLGARLYF